MAPSRPMTLSYAAALDDAGGHEAANPDELLLAALLWCSIESLRFHAKRQGIEVRAAGRASGSVTRPDGEERFRFVEIEVEVEGELRPQPDDLAQLLALAERDCFVASSLVVKPRYDWRIS